MIAAVAHIDLDALRANFALARELAGGRGVIGVIKAEAYGHGAAAVARVLRAEGSPELAVWSVEEALDLRDRGDAGALLVLRGVCSDEEAREALDRELTPVLHDQGQVELVCRAAHGRGRPAAVQVEVDTGMRRMGVPADRAAAWIAELARRPELELAGTFTHLARADEADLEPTRQQLRVFSGVLADLETRGVAAGCVHVANSAGLASQHLWESEAPDQQAVRPGLLLYGAQPAPAHPLRLRPVMSLHAPVVAVRAVRRGEAVGYGAVYRAPSDTRVATLALGYADGIPIAAGGEGRVWLAGARRPIAGRISMDYIGVDVGDAPVAVGDTAVVFGCEAPGGATRLSVDEAAAAAGTIAYELLAQPRPRVRHVLHGV